MLGRNIVCFSSRPLKLCRLSSKPRFTGSECYCANSIVNGATTSTGCTMTCSGNSAQTCGGSYAINVYHLGASSSTTSTISSTPTTTSTSLVTTTSASPTTTTASSSSWSSVGCYTDSTTRVLTGYSTSSNSLTTASCQSTCAGLGYSYAGTEYSKFSGLVPLDFSDY